MKTVALASFNGSFLAFFLFVLSACSTKVRVSGFRVPDIQTASKFAAGAASIDITPPPGFPFGGHGPAGNVAIGFWTHLYARAFYFKPTESHPFAMASVDLWAVPQGLTQKVLEIVNREGIALPPDRFILSATHTHHSPGNYMTSRVHSDMASFKPGYDPELFGWLAKRIAKAITLAALGSGPSHLSLFEGVSCDLQINRSLQPFAENPEHALIIDARNVACGDKQTPPPPRKSAVNPTLRVLKIDHVDQGAGPAGLMIFYAIHPTVLRARVPLYSGDLVSAAMLHLEQSYRHHGSSLVAGFFNGAEGDIIPPKVDRDLDEVSELGRKFGEEVLKLVNNGAPKILAEPQILSNHAMVSRKLVSQTPKRFASRPVGGVSLVGGGELDRSQHSPEGWWLGVSSDREIIRGQGNKAPALDKRVPIPLVGDWPLVREAVKLALLPPDHFPDYLPIALHVIPDLITFAVIPVEMTTAMGLRITNSIQKLSSPTASVSAAYQHAQIIGLANEYYSYTTTPEEYSLQHYEGASTLFGLQEGPILRERLLALNPTPTSSEMQQPATKFVAGARKEFGPDYFIELRSGPTQTNTLPDIELEDIIPKRFHFQEFKIPRFEWTEQCTERICPADWAPERRKIQLIQADNASVIVETEMDLRFVAVLRRGSILRGQDRHLARNWVVFWFPPKSSTSDGAYRFKIKKADTGQEICSESFTLGNLSMDRGILPRSLSRADCPQKLAE